MDVFSQDSFIKSYTFNIIYNCAYVKVFFKESFDSTHEIWWQGNPFLKLLFNPCPSWSIRKYIRLFLVECSELEYKEGGVLYRRFKILLFLKRKVKGRFFEKTKTQIFIAGIDLTENGQRLRLGITGGYLWFGLKNEGLVLNKTIWHFKVI